MLWRLALRYKARNGLVISDADRRHAVALASAGRLKALRKHVRRIAVGAERSDAGELDFLGTLLTHCGDPVRAQTCFTRALRLRPSDIAIRFNLATVQRMTGDLEGAEANLDWVVRADPHAARAHLLRSDMRRQTPDANHVAELEGALRRVGGGGLGTVLLCFALAKEFDDLGDYDRAFQYWKRGNDGHRVALDYDVNEDVRMLDAIRLCYCRPSRSSAGNSGSSDAPIFIMGLPRSGTTLVDRIISACPGVRSAGELRALSIAAFDWLDRKRDHLALHQLVSACRDGSELAPVGRDYLHEAVQNAAFPCRFTDKMPLNFMYIPLILESLPQANIILLRRDPVDTCFALYRCFLTSPYHYASSLTDLASYYRAWSGLMDHWLDIFGPRITLVRYEDLVTDSETTIRNMKIACRLEFEDGYKTPVSGGRSFATPSAVQVRHPIHSSSVGKWKPYSKHLQPLISGLS